MDWGYLDSKKDFVIKKNAPPLVFKERGMRRDVRRQGGRLKQVSQAYCLDIF